MNELREDPKVRAIWSHNYDLILGRFRVLKHGELKQLIIESLLINHAWGIRHER